MEQELLTLPEQMSSLQFPVSQSLVFCVVFSPLIFFLLVIVLSPLHFVIFKHFLFMLLLGFVYLREVVVAVIVWHLDLQLPMHPVPITMDVVSLNPAQGEVHNIMWWSMSVICGRSVVFSRYFRFPPPIKLSSTIKLKLNTIKAIAYLSHIYLPSSRTIQS